MTTDNPIIDENLNRAASIARWLRFCRHTATLGSVVALMFLLLALGLVKGWLSNPIAANAFVAVVIVVAVIAWIWVGLAAFRRDLDPLWLARIIEKGQPKLLDRVNTLAALWPSRYRPEVSPFYRSIARQAQDLLLKEPAAIRISPARTLLHLATFLVLLVATMEVYKKFSPWARMRAADDAKRMAVRPKPSEPTLELPPPDKTVEQKQAWGEVRITDPGRDMQATKVDVVPLQIEAAANEPLEKVGWASTINGAEESFRELPAPAEPRYAVYQPLLYLDELKLSDWDVLTYYAKAATRATNSFASEVYFIEVRPFREDILKLPGGENGTVMQYINQLSGLISEQQHIIRETHQHIQTPPETANLRERDRQKLADGETDLSKATRHLYAKMATELENKPIGEALDHLARAEKSLNQAAESLNNALMKDAQNQERSGLADLVATRKAFQKGVSDNPKEFGEKSPPDQEPVAEPKDKLKEIAEFRNEAAAAQDLIQKLMQQESSLAERANKAAPPNLAKLAVEQTQIQQSLKEFRQQHPQVFKPVQPEADATAQSLQNAAQSLEKKDRNAKTQVQEAADTMQKLAEAMKERSTERQLTDAYQLKQVLDRQIEKFGQCENPGPGGGPSGAEMKKAVTDTQQALEHLKNIAQQPLMREAFGPPLAESLNDLNMQSLKWAFGELDQATTPETKQKAAGQAKNGVEKVTKAFEKSQPKAMQAANRAKQGGPQMDNLERGLSQLESLIKQLESRRPVSPEDQARQGKEALYNLQSGLRGFNDNNERSKAILMELEHELTPGEDKPHDLGALKRLMDALQAFSVEVLARRDQRPDKPEVSAIEPARLPPAYRSRIEKYFQKLSEK